MISLLFWAYLPDVLVFRRILKAVIVFEIRGSESEDKFCRPDVEQQVSEEIGATLAGQGCSRCIRGVMKWLVVNRYYFNLYKRQNAVVYTSQNNFYCIIDYIAYVLVSELISWNFELLSWYLFCFELSNLRIGIYTIV